MFITTKDAKSAKKTITCPESATPGPTYYLALLASLVVQ